MTKDLTPKQKKAVAALLTNWNVRSAAKDAGVSRDTVYRWLEQEEFRNGLNSASQKVLEDVSRGLVALSTSALENLHDMLIDPYEAPAVKLRAAEMVLSKALDLRSKVDLEARIKALEKKGP